MIAKIVLLIIGLFSGLAIAEECTPIDLNLSEPLKSMPVLDQGQTGQCYAFQATQLIEFQMRKHGIAGYPLSTSDASYTYKTAVEKKKNGDLSGGFGIFTTLTVAAKGVMPSKCVDDAVKEITEGSTTKVSELVAILENPTAEKAGIKIDQYAKTMDALKFRYVTCTPPETFTEDLFRFGKNINRLTSMYVVGDILRGCEKFRVPVPNIQSTNVWFGDDKKYRSAIDNIVGRGDPAGIDVCFDTLSEGRRGLIEGSVSREPKDWDHCSPHAMLVVGRRKVGGKCQYMLRNSWGGDWGSFNPTFKTCACRASDGTYYEDCNVYEKKVVQSKDSKSFLDYLDRTYLGCWVDADRLFSNAREVNAVFYGK